MLYNDWKDQMVSKHFAFRSTAFIKDRSEVRYINECATKDTIEACESLGWEVPKLGQWCVVSGGIGIDRAVTHSSKATWLSGREVLELAHSEGWHVPAPPDGASAGEWVGNGTWSQWDFTEIDDDLPADV